MSYRTGNSNRPFEQASKSSHHHVINDPIVQSVLDGLWIPPEKSKIPINEMAVDYNPTNADDIKYIIAVDGGYTEVPVRKTYPSATVTFFQFGALLLRSDDLIKLESKAFISPKDMSALSDIQRIKFVLPTKNVRDKDKSTLKETVRSHIHNFFKNETLGEKSSLLDTLKWFIFKRYKKSSSRTQDDSVWYLPTNPINPELSAISVRHDDLTEDGTILCPQSGEKIYLTDVFRLHEIVNEEIGATGISGYLSGIIEHIIVLHIIRILLTNDPQQLKSILFLLDRPTGFFGQTAPFHSLMLDLVNWLFENDGIYLVGTEKSGSFVDHARELQTVMKAGTILILNNNYIYNYITPGAGDISKPYASSSYYGHKVIFKSSTGEMYVVSIPVKKLMINPTIDDLPNIYKILTMIEQLHCNLYESALLPITLANKLVSLSAHPSSEVLRSFAKGKMS